MVFGRKHVEMVTADTALAGRTDQTMPVPVEHFVLEPQGRLLRGQGQRGEEREEASHGART